MSTSTGKGKTASRQGGNPAGASGAGRATGSARPETAKVRTAPVLRMVARHAPQTPKTPFVLLVLSLLGGGLVVLLLLNSAAAADAFTQKRLRQQNEALSLREQQLSREVAASEAPGALAERARRLGMVPSGDQGFLVLQPDGSVRVAGSPVPATSPAPPPPSPSATPSAAPGARPSATPSTTAGAGTPRAGTPVTTPAPRTTPTPKPTPTPQTTPTPAPGGTR